MNRALASNRKPSRHIEGTIEISAKIEVRDPGAKGPIEEAARFAGQGE